MSSIDFESEPWLSAKFLTWLTNSCEIQQSDNCITKADLDKEYESKCKNKKYFDCKVCGKKKINTKDFYKHNQSIEHIKAKIGIKDDELFVIHL